MLKKHRYNSVERFVELSLNERGESQRIPYYRRKSQEQPTSTPIASIRNGSSNPQTPLIPSPAPIVTRRMDYNLPEAENRPTYIYKYNEPSYAPPATEQQGYRDETRPASYNIPPPSPYKQQPKLLQVPYGRVPSQARRPSRPKSEQEESFLDRNVPSEAWIGLLILQFIAGLASILIGALKYHHCFIDHGKIPIYLIVSGCLLIINASFRAIPYVRQNSSKTKSKGLLEYTIEGIIFSLIVVNLILGCVWIFRVHGYVRYEHYGYGGYESFRLYCDYLLYWTAWWSVILHLVTVSVIVLLLVVLLIYTALSGK